LRSGFKRNDLSKCSMASPPPDRARGAVSAAVEK
jgi:hypothetical protein